MGWRCGIVCLIERWGVGIGDLLKILLIGSIPIIETNGNDERR